VPVARQQEGAPEQNSRPRRDEGGEVVAPCLRVDGNLPGAASLPLPYKTLEPAHTVVTGV